MARFGVSKIEAGLREVLNRFRRKDRKKSGQEQKGDDLGEDIDTNSTEPLYEDPKEILYESLSSNHKKHNDKGRKLPPTPKRELIDSGYDSPQEEIYAEIGRPLPKAPKKKSRKLPPTPQQKLEEDSGYSSQEELEYVSSKDITPKKQLPQTPKQSGGNRKTDPTPKQERKNPPKKEKDFIAFNKKFGAEIARIKRELGELQNMSKKQASSRATKLTNRLSQINQLKPDPVTKPKNTTPLSSTKKER